MLPVEMKAVEAYALDLLRSRRKHWSLPQPFYTEQAFHELDLKHIWQRNWIFVSLSCEIPNPGDWTTVEIGADSVIILRDNDRQIRAFANSCRHRGARICLESHGSSKRLVCPYHQWSYALNGELIRTRYMEGDFDRREFGLKPVHVENVAGWIFISLAEEAPPFADMRAALEPFIAPQDVENSKVAYTQVLNDKANWKLVMENNRECYHCAANHPELLRTLAEFDNPDDPRVDPKYVALMRQKNAEWESQGIPVGPTDPHIRYRAVRLPFIDGHKSMTMDGKLVTTRLMGNLPDSDLGSVRMLSLPNNWNHLLADHSMAFRVLPKGPQETELVTKWLVHKDAVEGVDYDVEHLTAVWKATNQEDKELSEWNQLGINTSKYEPGPYSAQIEMGVKDLVQWYTDELEVELCKALGEPVPVITTEPTPRPVFVVPTAAVMQGDAANQLPAE
ncbi:aromatic ring-hydroxylating oxygenase subunit alpha [Chthonobacter albigriseus]|uniref:aromatic ring-hydroxylating oxygenase subunit alpha n=1 Tax=Chthonobacter albigriseus TaxID=1683161 RepID=UPI0015EF83C5|nr:aromatic ring-hydroxylating dioxygenase subunit alpha [Chthonobacter albigriseus]